MVIAPGPRRRCPLKKALLLCRMLAAIATAASAQMPTGGYPGAQPVKARVGQGIHYLYLVRHGIYDRDSSATDDRVGNGLNALGHGQAKLAAARPAALPVKFTHLVAGRVP